HCIRDLRDVHSFPTRRSSDLTCVFAERVRSAVPRAIRTTARNAVVRASSRDGQSRPTRVDGAAYDDAPDDMGNLQKIVPPFPGRSEEHTSELQSRGHLVCRLL